MSKIYELSISFAEVFAATTHRLRPLTMLQRLRAALGALQFLELGLLASDYGVVVGGDLFA